MDKHDKLRVFTEFQHWLGGRYINLPTDSGNMTERARQYLKANPQALDLVSTGGSLQFSEHDVDFAYLCGVFNTSGIDGLHNEIQRLRELGKNPHDIIQLIKQQQ
jgi:hypothetical protein